MNYSTAEIWTIIALMGVGTFAIRFSFLGLIGDREIPPLVTRMLRFTPVAVLPGMVAPLVLWPTGAGGDATVMHVLAAAIALFVAYKTRKVVWGMGAGFAVFFVPQVIALL